MYILYGSYIRYIIYEPYTGIDMKLPKIAKEGKPARLTLSIPESDVTLLDNYAKFYEDIYKEPIKQNELIRHILKHYIESDKDFLKFQNTIAIKHAEAA